MRLYLSSEGTNSIHGEEKKKRKYPKNKLATTANISYTLRLLDITEKGKKQTK